MQSGPPRKVLDQPANVEVARLLGISNLFQAEIAALDPGRNTSRLRVRDFELNGPYFPGQLRGDRVWLCARAEELRAQPHNGSRPGAEPGAGAPVARIGAGAGRAAGVRGRDRGGRAARTIRAAEG